MLAGYFYFFFPLLQPWGNLQAGCRRLALCIAECVRMNNGGKRLCQRVREQQMRKKAGLSRKRTQYRPGLKTRGQADTKTEPQAPRPGEARCPFLLTPCKGVNYRLPPRNTSNFSPATQSTKALQQMFKIKLYLGPCYRLHLVSLSWMIKGRSSALKNPLIFNHLLDNHWDEDTGTMLTPNTGLSAGKEWQCPSEEVTGSSWDFQRYFPWKSFSYIPLLQLVKDEHASINISHYLNSICLRVQHKPWAQSLLWKVRKSSREKQQGKVSTRNRAERKIQIKRYIQSIQYYIPKDHYIPRARSPISAKIQAIHIAVTGSPEHGCDTASVFYRTPPIILPWCPFKYEFFCLSATAFVLLILCSCLNNLISHPLGLDLSWILNLCLPSWTSLPHQQPQLPSLLTCAIPISLSICTVPFPVSVSSSLLPFSSISSPRPPAGPHFPPCLPLATLAVSSCSLCCLLPHIQLPAVPLHLKLAHLLPASWAPPEMKPPRLQERQTAFSPPP